jgi:hypothetical protein
LWFRRGLGPGAAPPAAAAVTSAIAEPGSRRVDEVRLRVDGGETDWVMHVRVVIRIHG